MHPVSDPKIPGAELADRYAIDLCLTNRERNVLCEILKKNDAAETAVVDEDDAGDDGKNCRHDQKFNERESFHNSRFIGAKPFIFEIHTMSVAAIRNGPNGISLFIVNPNTNGVLVFLPPLGIKALFSSLTERDTYC